MTVVANGPLLIEGPIEVVLPDGTVRAAERPVVALCACHRSRTYPFCDTSHRRRARRPGRDVQQPDSRTRDTPDTDAHPPEADSDGFVGKR
ncbi:CDGSH iron-sulfur domain-containing protein [Kitasatospora sp. NPDC048194]|uniref:CDGSH iron-sulfur domain-containing protein n=1 Tax=Kitasatospora sp. NPDC048194 TaxID=3364045 RepID=UPI003723BE50